MPFSKRLTVCERSLIFRFNCEVLNKTNSENRRLVFVTFKKKKDKKRTESVILRLYSKDIVRPMSNHWFDNVFGIKTKYHRLRRFLVFFLNIRNTRCLFSEFVLFCTSLICLLVVFQCVKTRKV